MNMYFTIFVGTRDPFLSMILPTFLSKVGVDNCVMGDVCKRTEVEVEKGILPWFGPYTNVVLKGFPFFFPPYSWVKLVLNARKLLNLTLETENLEVAVSNYQSMQFLDSTTRYLFA